MLITELREGQTGVQSSASMQDWFVNFSDFLKTSLGCRNLVPAPSHTTLSETLVHASWTIAQRADSFRICLAKSLLNLGQAPTSQHKPSRASRVFFQPRLLELVTQPTIYTGIPEHLSNQGFQN